MNNNGQKGFSLIELLLVVTIIGIIAAVAIPNFRKGLAAAENSSTNGTMKIILSAQSMHYSQKNRYGRLDEVNGLQENTLGQITNNQMTRGKFLYEMVPANPTDDELKNGFSVIATRQTGVGDLPYVVEINQAGFTTQIFP